MKGVDRQLKVWLVQQGVWQMAKESLPLAAGYLKAALQADPALRGDVDVRIWNFDGAATATDMVHTLFTHDVPDVLAFSVLGWNMRAFGAVASTYRQLNKQGWIVFGGNHVAKQGERVFARFPQVDVVVDGEGELTFKGIVEAILAGSAPDAFGQVLGLTYRNAGVVCSTPSQPRISDLNSIPSPFLTGAVDMTVRNGEFRYDVALMETNRGCPYSCAFCYWGGAIGQKLRRFDRARLAAELDLFAYYQAPSIVLCDSNFGMLPEDLEFVEDVIRVRERTGFPITIETSWAKNKSSVFFEIVRLMKRKGLSSSFSLALQSLEPMALETMARKNMRINKWQELSQWLQGEGLDCYAELIWGLPGETRESFLAGYDTLAADVARVAVYPLLLLPNTSYYRDREKHGFVTIVGTGDDFEYVIGHNGMTIAQNAEMQHFVFWARAIAENGIFRHIWLPLRRLAELRQSEVLLSMGDWFNRCDSPVAEPLKTLGMNLVDAATIARSVRYIYQQPEVQVLFARWWAERIEGRIPEEYRDFLAEVFRYDQLCRPRLPQPGADLTRVEQNGVIYLVQPDVGFAYDIADDLARLAVDPNHRPERKERHVSLYYRAGFSDDLVDNHEIAAQYAAREGESVLRSEPLNA